MPSSTVTARDGQSAISGTRFPVYPFDKSVLLLETHAWPARRFTPVADQFVITKRLYPPDTWLTRTLRGR